MKNLALVLTLLLTLNTTTCMRNEIARNQKVLLPIGTDVIEDDADDSSCCELALDLGLSCGAGSTLAYGFHHMFNNPLATLGAFAVGTLMTFGIQTGEPFKENHVFNQKEKTD